jgi:hypothetical protein
MEICDETSIAELQLKVFFSFVFPQSAHIRVHYDFTSSLTEGVFGYH